MNKNLYFYQNQKQDLSGLLNSNQSQIIKSNLHIADIEKKIKSFGGLDEIEEQVLIQLQRNTQRLDNLIEKVRSFMKLDSKEKRKSIHRQNQVGFNLNSNQSNSNIRLNNSSISKNSAHNLIKQKNMRLKDRVQRAITQQSHSSIKYLK